MKLGTKFGEAILAFSSVPVKRLWYNKKFLSAVGKSFTSKTRI
jgi:hypothetical protein